MKIRINDIVEDVDLTERERIIYNDGIATGWIIGVSLVLIVVLIVAVVSI